MDLSSYDTPKIASTSLSQGPGPTTNFSLSAYRIFIDLFMVSLSPECYVLRVPGVVLNLSTQKTSNRSRMAAVVLCRIHILKARLFPTLAQPLSLGNLRFAIPRLYRPHNPTYTGFEFCP